MTLAHLQASIETSRPAAARSSFEGRHRRDMLSFWSRMDSVALTSARRVLAWPTLWLAVLIGGLIGLPSLIWQAVHGWPFLEVHANHLSTGANFTGTPIRFEIIQCRMKTGARSLSAADCDEI
jgi:hypothetical protein